MLHARQFPPYRHESGRRAALAVLVHELLHGQWRRPEQLFGHISVAADDERMYVGTNLGLFAISASTGRREWYALPMMELGDVTPSLTPAGAATSP